MNELKRVLACAALVVAAVVGSLAQQTARGAQPPPQPLTTSRYLGHDTIAGCSKAGTFVNTPEYIVQCSNRTGPGVVEIHTKETDVIYVIDGTASFVTGGTAKNITATNPLQPRGHRYPGRRRSSSHQGRCDRGSCGAAALVQGSARLGQLLRGKGAQTVD